MLWIFFSFLCALSNSFADVFRKQATRKADAYVIAFAFRFACLVFLLPWLVFTSIPEFGKDFWFALVVVGLTNALTTVLYIKALEVSDLSLAIPMLNFTPVFLLFTTPLIAHEIPSFFGLLGVIFVVIGSYILNIKQGKLGLLNPLKALVENKGVKLMLLVAFIWGISSAYDKIGIQNSSPIFWGIITSLFLTLALFPVMLFKSKNIVTQIKENFKPIIFSGLAMSFLVVFQMIAMSMALVVYVIAIKRTSALISTFFGWLFFKEKNIKDRLIGAAIMFIGVLLIAVF